MPPIQRHGERTYSLTAMESRKWGDVADDWQKADALAIDPALQRAIGRSDKPARSRVWLERPRGHDKTSSIGQLCVYALAFATRPVKAYAYASDRDQSKLLLTAMQTCIRMNPYLADILAVEQHRVVNHAAGHPAEGGSLVVESSDVASSWGILPDLICLDEVTHWPDAGEQLWQSLLSAAVKRENCLLCSIQNSGFMDSWQWKVREVARTDEAWIFSRLEGPQASWLTPSRLDEMKRMLPPVAYARLFDNCWSTGGGDALSPETISRAFQNELQQQSHAMPGFTYTAGLDLGVSRDASAGCVLGVRQGAIDHGRIVLAAHKVWRPAHGQKVDLTAVEDAVREFNRNFGLKTVAYDPWQATGMAQRLQAVGLTVGERFLPKFHSQPVQPSRVRMIEVPATGNNLQKMASTLIEAFNDGRVHLYDCPDLRRNLIKLRVEERSYGFRLTSPRDETGHGDLCSAVPTRLVGSERVS